jgi:amino acid transporter
LSTDSDDLGARRSGTLGRRFPRAGSGIGPRPRAGKHAEAGHELDVPRGLAALSLDALTSVAYGPEAIMVALAAAGAAALTWTQPLLIVITGMLALLIVSYSQVIVAYPDGGGAYAVAKANLGRTPALLAAAAVVVDYVLTVAVSLAAGAASLGSAFPALAQHRLLVSIAGLVLLTAVNMFGIGASAKVLMAPMALFLLSVLSVIVVGLVRGHPATLIGHPESARAVEGLGLVVILKAFASGCSAVTGVEAIANGVPAFREPRVRTARRTEITLGALLATMLVGIAVLIGVDHTRPRGGVTVLAQLSAGAFGTGWAFYVSGIAVAIALGLAANTSFGGLPVLMSLLARDHRLPHAFYLRAEKPIYRLGIASLAAAALVLLLASGAETINLIPLFAIGVFIGFTLSQLGLVRHWRRERPARWRLRAVVNAAGAAMTAVVVAVLLATKLLEGAWAIVIAVPFLIWLFSHTEAYYAEVGRELRLGRTPPMPSRRESIVIVPSSTVSLLTERAVSAALSLGDTAVAIAVAADEDERRRILTDWSQWRCEIPIEVVVDPHRSLIRTVLKYVSAIDADDAVVMVLIPEILPRKRRHEILHNQRGRLLAAVLKARTDVIVATLPFKLHE